jgi:hypothetical protein
MAVAVATYVEARRITTGIMLAAMIMPIRAPSFIAIVGV